MSLKITSVYYLFYEILEMNSFKCLLTYWFLYYYRLILELNPLNKKMKILSQFSENNKFMTLNCNFSMMY